MVVVAAGSIVASAVLASDSATVTVVDSAVVDSAIAVFAQATADSIVSEADLADQSMVGTVDMAVGTVDTPDPSIAVTVVDTAVTADMVAEVAVAGKRV